MKYLVLFICLIVIFYQYKVRLPDFMEGSRVKITTKVLSEPLVFDNQQYLKVLGLKIYLPKYPKVNYGDNVILEGVVKEGYLKNAKLLETKESDNILFNFRKNIIAFYKQSLPEPYSSLIAGIVIGSKQMPEDFWNKLVRTGTAHIVVASGTNITLLTTMLILSLTYIVKRKYAVFITLAVILIYVIVSGFDAPIVRASIMGLILLFGQLTGRVTDTWRILLYTSISMLMFKPEWATDLGFILSFVATASLLLFQKKIDSYLSSLPNILREGLSTSLAAQIGVAPIIYATFGQFNILSPIVNAMVLWVVPYLMVGGLIAGLIGQVVPLIGRLILFVLFPLLWYFEKVIDLFV